MSALLPVAVYGLKVPAGDVMIPALMDLPATFRITMAAIDPSAPPEYGGTANGDSPARATLKIIYDPSGPLDDDESDDDDEERYLESLMREDDDGESSSEEEGKNGGPSDPSKTKKARKQAAAEQMMKALAENDSDDEMSIDGKSGSNGVLSQIKKGKGKATDDDDNSDDDEDDLDGLDELVLCTLDTSKNYQQPLDITIGEDQRAYFKVSGNHAIYLTGNYLMPVDDGRNHRHEIYDDDDDADYDLSPDEADLDGSSESDELDDLQDPRITELASEDENEPPKLIKKEEPGKVNKKRAAEDSDEEPANLDEIMAKALKPTESSTNGEPKLSKKQLKKLKNNAGKAVEAAVEKKSVEKVDEVAKDKSNSKADKKVQFARNLEQGPSGPINDSKSNIKAEEKADSTKSAEKPTATLGKKTVQGVIIDDKKLGKGPAAKKGSKVSMRYIGKLEDGKVFDANKKGTPFTFTLGTGEVIKGWDIGVIGMTVGGERRITIPANLAYGNKAKPGIPANSKLIFDIKVLEVK